MKDYFSYYTVRGRWGDEPDYAQIVQDLIKEHPDMDIRGLISCAIKWSKGRLNPAFVLDELKKYRSEE